VTVSDCSRLPTYVLVVMGSVADVDVPDEIGRVDATEGGRGPVPTTEVVIKDDNALTGMGRGGASNGDADDEDDDKAEDKDEDEDEDEDDEEEGDESISSGPTSPIWNSSGGAGSL
jgi:hypothetical protein